MPDEELNLQTPPEVEETEDQDPEPEQTGETEDPETSESEPEPEGDTETPQTVSLDEYQKVMGQLKWAERQLKRKDDGAEQVPITPGPTAKPKVGDYEVYDDYVEALADWKLDQRDQQNFQTQKNNELAEKQRKVDAKIAAEVAKNPDFLKSAYVPEALGELLMDSDYFIEIAKHFGENPSEAFEICKLSKLDAARKIGKLESKLEAKSQGPKPKTESRAPSSTKNIIGGGDTPEKKPEDMTTEEYIAWKNKQEFGE